MECAVAGFHKNKLKANNLFRYTLAIDPRQVPGTLAFNYQKPYVRATFDLYKGLTYRMTWNYYGYNGKAMASNAIPGLAGIPVQDFNGSTTEFAFRYSF